jgi:hypothetical protein
MVVMHKKILSLAITSLFSLNCLLAQDQHPVPVRDFDSNYFYSYKQHLTTRIYLATKYNTFSMRGVPDVPVLKFDPNTKLILGLGVTYRAVSLNIGAGFNVFNDDNIKGKTHSLDIQTHVYRRNWIFDVFGQFYRGYYLSPAGAGFPSSGPYYLRPDMRLTLVGLAGFYNMNPRRFSYQSLLLQNEWQRKSAGALLLGGEFYYGSIHGDSALAPQVYDPLHLQGQIRTIHFLKFGPGIGYAYTLVYREHLFLTGSATLNLDLGYSSESGISESRSQADIHPGFLFKAGGGYNTAGWMLNLVWEGKTLEVDGRISNYFYRVSAGNLNLTFARRFPLRKSIRKKLDLIPH